MTFHIETEFIHADNEAERWIIKTTIDETTDGESGRRDEFTVYIDPDKIEVTPIPTTEVRSVFGWDDWIFDNLLGDLEAAAAIATLAVFGNEDTYGAVVELRYPQKGPKVVDMLEDQE